MSDLHEHTPGPWRIDVESDDNLSIVGPMPGAERYGVKDEWTIASVGDEAFWDDEKHRLRDESNARLIAASPELYQMVDELHSCLQKFVDTYDDFIDGSARPTLNDAAELLNRIEGKIMREYDEWEQRQLLAWKAGKTFTRPLAGALTALQQKGLVGPGDILSSEITELGWDILEGRKPFPKEE